MDTVLGAPKQGFVSDTAADVTELLSLDGDVLEIGNFIKSRIRRRKKRSSGEVLERFNILSAYRATFYT